MSGALSLRDLNRATLARQLLLARERLDPATAIARVGGLQAQEPRPPFGALWTRLEGFSRAALHDALRAGDVVRGALMRATLHMVTVADYAVLRPTVQPVLTGSMEAILRQRGPVDLDRVLPAARELLAERPRTFNELRDLLSARFPDTEQRALGYAVRMQLPLLMVPIDDPWAFPADARFALAGIELGAPDPAALIRRHLAAFGPATAADVQNWSGLKGLADPLAAIADELVAFKHGRRTLYDLADAPRPGEDVPAPPRLLPEFDSVLLAHQDRTRVIADDRRKAITTRNLRVQATFLVDGFVAGTWAVERKRGAATLTLSSFEPLAAGVRDALAAEAEALLAFLGESAPRVAFASR